MGKETKNTQTAGGVVLNKKGQVLVVNQRSNSWSLPKGHIDPGENAFEAAKREIYEESGINQLDFIKDLGSYQRYKIALDGGDDKSELKTIIMFLFKTDQMDLNPIDVHNPEARWVEPNEVSKLLTHPKDQDFMRSIIKQIPKL